MPDARTPYETCARTHLHMHADLRELSRAREALMQAAYPVLGARAHMLVLAVDEALANVIRHSGHDTELASNAATPNNEDIEFEIAVTPQAVEVQITDPFAAFDPRAVQEVQLNARVRARLRGGMGLGIMRRVLDQIDYARVDGRYNRLRLIKRREQSA
jgi:anti-sigma regulatory factor (Ser/Thr protein kinase)